MGGSAGRGEGNGGIVEEASGSDWATEEVWNCFVDVWAGAQMPVIETVA